MGINYRCEPMRERLKYHDDPAYIFSSLVHGDPATPILETYPGDEIIIRLLDGAHEEQHSFNLTGLSWKKEITDVFSPQVASQTLGISEAFNIHIEKAYQPGDYLYYFGGIDDAWLGLWGIIRAYRHVTKRLKPICHGKDSMIPLPPCPTKDSVVRKYEIAAIQRNIRYNKHGDHDPDGLIFVPLEEADAAMDKNYRPKPLILRANAGGMYLLIKGTNLPCVYLSILSFSILIQSVIRELMSATIIRSRPLVLGCYSCTGYPALQGMCCFCSKWNTHA